MNLLQCCCFLFFLLHGVTGIDEMFVCKRVTDTCGRTDSRINELEERVKQLQLLLQTPYHIPDPKTDKITTTGQRFPRDCTELFDGGQTQDGIYKISPDGKCPFDVFCDIRNGGWTLIQKRQDGSINFNRDWDDYVRGFGKLDGEHWIGLEKIHRLTQDGSQVHFTLEMYDGKIEHADYKAFTVYDATTAYKMNVDPYDYEGSLPELFSYHNNMRFATFDRDINSCVSKLGGGGWWYNNCYQLANVNGVYGAQTEAGISYWDTQRRNIKNVTVKLQRSKYACD